MGTASRAFAGGTLPAALSEFPSVGAIPSGVRAIAKLFNDAQEQRHAADYDLSERYTRSDALALIDAAQAEIDRWQAVRRDPMARLYLISLLLWDRMKKS